MAREDPALLLPPELLELIFSILDQTSLLRCSAVSQSWRSLCRPFIDDVFRLHEYKTNILGKHGKDERWPQSYSKHGYELVRRNPRSVLRLGRRISIRHGWHPEMRDPDFLFYAFELLGLLAKSEPGRVKSLILSNVDTGSIVAPRFHRHPVEYAKRLFRPPIFRGLYAVLPTLRHLCLIRVFISPVEQFSSLLRAAVQLEHLEIHDPGYYYYRSDGAGCLPFRLRTLTLEDPMPLIFRGAFDFSTLAQLDLDITRVRSMPVFQGVTGWSVLEQAKQTLTCLILRVASDTDPLPILRVLPNVQTLAMHCHDWKWTLLEHILREIKLSALGIQTIILRCPPACTNWSAIDKFAHESRSPWTLHIECHTLPSSFPVHSYRRDFRTVAEIKEAINRMESSLPRFSDLGNLQVHRLDSSLDYYVHESRYPAFLYKTS